MACVTMILLIVASVVIDVIVLIKASVYSLVHCGALQSLLGAGMMAALAWIHHKTVVAEVVVACHHLSASSSELMRRWLSKFIIASCI